GRVLDRRARGAPAEPAPVGPAAHARARGAARQGAAAHQRPPRRPARPATGTLLPAPPGAGPPGARARRPARPLARGGGPPAAQRLAPRGARPLRGGLAVHLRDPPARGADAAGVRVAAAHRAAHARSARRVPQLARPRGERQGAAGAGLRAHGPLARHGVVESRARPSGTTSARTHPPVSGTIAVLQADVFTTRPFGGNPAVAVLDADGLDEAAMQRIAGELRAPGTAFVSASSRPDADWRLRMFTPRREVAYSGHTTIGATHALIEGGRAPGPHVVFDTPAGLVRVEIARDEAGCLMWLEPPLPATRTPT